MTNDYLLNMMIHQINYLLNFCGDLVWGLLGQNPYFTLLLVSVIAGVLLVYIYGKVSKQSKIKATKRAIYGALLEAILFRHSAWLTLKAQTRMFALGGRYLMLAIPPLLILMIPCVLLLAQLNRYVGYEPLTPGDARLVSAVAFETGNIFDLSLATQATHVAVSKPVRVPEELSATWRMDYTGKGLTKLVLQYAAQSVNLPLKTNTGMEAIAVVSNTWWKALLYPTTIKLPDGLEELVVSYNDAEYSLLGWHTHWVIYFFIVSLISGLFASRVFKIEI